METENNQNEILRKTLESLKFSDSIENAINEANAYIDETLRYFKIARAILTAKKIHYYINKKIKHNITKNIMLYFYLIILFCQ